VLSTSSGAVVVTVRHDCGIDQAAAATTNAANSTAAMTRTGRPDARCSPAAIAWSTLAASAAGARRSAS
jgi:hypothetical protein